MSADLLRRAAALMRERAEEADRAWGSVPWSAGEIGWNERQGTTYDVHTSGDLVAMTGCEELAEHIASWHPAVALAVADSLDQSAAIIEEAFSGPLAMAMTAIAEPLIDVARVYLGADQ